MLRKLLCWCGEPKANVDSQGEPRATALCSRSTSSSVCEHVLAPPNGCRRGDGKAGSGCVARTPTQGSSQGTASTLAMTTSPSYKLDFDSVLVRNLGPRSTGDGASVLDVGLSPPAAPCRSAGPEAMRPLMQPALLSLRNLHLALTPAESLAASPSCFTVDATPSGDRPFSFELACMGLQGGDVGSSESSTGPFSLANMGQQLRFTSASQLAEEVQDMQLLGRGGYGVVALGNWKREGRVAVKVLLSEEDKFLDSCYKEAVLSRVLAHPNILQTYDFQTAVLCHEDVARAGVAWERMQSPHWHQQKQQPGCGGRSGCGAPEEGVCPQLHGMDGRMDSFELLPCGSSANGGHAPGGAGATVDFWQVLSMLGARAGQYVTLIIMEYAEVGTLHRAISAGAFREGGRLSRWAALRSLLVTAKEIAGGMCLLHSYKVIHGDLSGSNIMLKASRVDKRGFVAKVADFGLSKVTLSGVARTDGWEGQAHYLAPECLDSEARLASDVFAFGVLLYEMASGRRAFTEYHPAQILAGRIAGDLPLLWPADAHPELRALAERCMQHSPDARPSFKEVVDELRRQDNEAKAQHRACSARRRVTLDGHSAHHHLLLGASSYAHLPGQARSTQGIMGMATPHRLATAGGVVTAAPGQVLPPAPVLPAFGAGGTVTPGLPRPPSAASSSGASSTCRIRAMQRGMLTRPCSEHCARPVSQSSSGGGGGGMTAVSGTRSLHSGAAPGMRIGAMCNSTTFSYGLRHSSTVGSSALTVPLAAAGPGHGADGSYGAVTPGAFMQPVAVAHQQQAVHLQQQQQQQAHMLCDLQEAVQYATCVQLGYHSHVVQQQLVQQQLVQQQLQQLHHAGALALQAAMVVPVADGR